MEDFKCRNIIKGVFLVEIIIKLLKYFLRDTKNIGLIGSIKILLIRLFSFIFASGNREKYTNHNNKIFEIFNIKRSKMEDIYEKILHNIEIDKWKHSTNLKKTQDGSIHHLIFCGLKSINFKPENILEVGTYTGESTEFLAKLFPNSKIFSIDLPENDPIYKKYFDPKIQNYLNERLNKIKKLENVELIKTNSAFLMDQNLPKMDLIWNDGDMFYPDVAWENAYLYTLLNDDGFLLNDDVHLEENKITKYKKNYLNIIETQRYLESRITTKYYYFFKNENFSQNIFYPKRISILKK